MKDLMLIIHFLGLIIGMGAGFTNMFVGRSNKDMEKEEASKFFLRLRVTGYMGIVGVTLLVISGGYLMTPYWSSLAAMPLMIAKLILVLILIVLIILMDRRWKGAIKDGGGPNLMALPKLGMIALPVGIAIIILAVLTFH